MIDLPEFLLARIAEDEAAARWGVSPKVFAGWTPTETHKHDDAADVPTPDYGSDDEDAMATRNPVVMEVEPDRNLRDPRWLPERVEHVRRHDPARVLAECEAKRRIVGLHPEILGGCQECANEHFPCRTLRVLATVYADHPDYRDGWRP